MRHFLTLFLFLSTSVELLAANADTLRYSSALSRLKLMGDSMLNSKSDSIRIASEADFALLTDSILHAPDGTLLSFYSVRALSVTVSDDNLLRLYTWMQILDKGNTYRFGGIAASRTDRKVPFKIFRLTEKKYTDNEGTSFLKLDSTNWLGCVYYNIIRQKYEKKTSYVALGWAPQSMQTTRKIIEPVVISNTKIIFGAPVLKEKGKKTRLRTIFEYNARATMSLRYEEKNNRIVFDHLAPSDPRPESKGVYSMYGPDLSYDGYEFVKGSWLLRTDIEMNNPDLNQGKEGKFFGK